MSEVGEGGSGNRSFEPPKPVISREQILKNAAALKDMGRQAMEGMRERVATPGTVQGTRARESVELDEAKLRARQEVDKAMGRPEQSQATSQRAQDILTGLRQEIAQSASAKPPTVAVRHVAPAVRLK